jgi:hypothetical protein
VSTLSWYALALVHDDGHIRQVPALPAVLTVIEELGITGWRTEVIDLRDAPPRMMIGRRCATCDLTLPCGCLATFAFRGGCPHGGYDLVIAAQRKAGLWP